MPEPRFRAREAEMGEKIAGAHRFGAALGRCAAFFGRRPGRDHHRVDIVAQQRRADTAIFPTHSRIVALLLHREAAHVDDPAAHGRGCGHCGLARWVIEFGPCRLGKLRLIVDTARMRGLRISVKPLPCPPHIEQPGSPQLKPASRKIVSSPSASACYLTCCEPGTTQAMTVSATLWPRATDCRDRKSEMRLLAHEPMKTKSTGVPAIAVPACSPV